MAMTLRRTDLSAALAFVRDAGEAEDSAAFRRFVLEGLPRLVPSSRPPARVPGIPLIDIG